MSYLYLLVNREGSAFKIGVSVDPARRGAVLPQALDLNSSRQVPMEGGRAYKIEGLLHYWFRDHMVAMPQGDGYTEWFDIAAWPAVLDFLAEQRERLGVGEPQPIPKPVPRPRTDSDLAAAREQRKENRRRAWEQRFAERREAAIKRNRATVEYVRRALAGAAEHNAVIGGLFIDEGAGTRGLLYLKGDHELLELGLQEALRPGVAELGVAGRFACGVAVTASTAVFPNWFICGTLAEVHVRAEFLSPVPLAHVAYPCPGCGRKECTAASWPDVVPSTDALQRLLALHVAPRGSREEARLLRLRRRCVRAARQFSREFGTAWGANSGGVW